MLQYKLLKTLCWVKELSHKGQHITWLYSCEEKEAGLKRPEVDRCLLARGLRSWLQVVGRNWSHCFRRAHPGRKMSYSGPLCPSLLLPDYLGGNLQGPGISSGDSCEKEKPERGAREGCVSPRERVHSVPTCQTTFQEESGAKTEINKMTKARNDEWHQTLSRTA